MLKAIEITKTCINYLGLSGNKTIFAKTSLAVPSNKLYDPPQRIFKDYDKYINSQSQHWLFNERIPNDRLALAQQVHDNKICYISKPGIYSDIDGFYTDHPEIYLTIRTADCAAVLVSVPEIPAVGIAHVGWRGASENIIGNLINQMTKRWDINSASIRIAISSHIKSCCYEVGNEFANFFQSEYLKHRNSKPYLDLEKIISDQLMEFDINKENLSVSPDCTFCSNLPLFSYRAQQKTTNRLLSVIAIPK